MMPFKMVVMLFRNYYCWCSVELRFPLTAILLNWKVVETIHMKSKADGDIALYFIYFAFGVFSNNSYTYLNSLDPGSACFLIELMESHLTGGIEYGHQILLTQIIAYCCNHTILLVIHQKLAVTFCTLLVASHNKNVYQLPIHILVWQVTLMFTIRHSDIALISRFILIIYQFLQNLEPSKEHGTGSETWANKEAGTWAEGVSPAPAMAMCDCIAARRVIPGGSALGKEIQGMYMPLLSHLLPAFPGRWGWDFFRVPGGIASICSFRLCSLPETFLLRGITDVRIGPGYYHAVCPFPGESHGEEHCPEPVAAVLSRSCLWYVSALCSDDSRSWTLACLSSCRWGTRACLWWQFLEIYTTITIVSNAERLWYVCVWITDCLHHCMSFFCWLEFGEFWADRASRNYRWGHHDPCLRLGPLFPHRCSPPLH